ncbi:hypothetical protein BDW74DRAFT_177259 [Aspergillus multicolor]|uniref:uncharacterized protein n=1 Tax=Aspergillus multicolor TaxID=41759 RepID=UPI003CCE17AC
MPYNVEPAVPILASSLLYDDSSQVTDREKTEPNLDPSTRWNLKLDMQKGLHPRAPNEDDIFRPGTVIGFSRLRGRSPEGNEDEFVGELPRHLLTTWLRRTSPSSPPTKQSNPSQNPQKQARTRAYIIHPPNSTIFPPARLLSSLLSNSTPNPIPSPQKPATLITRKEAISLLDTVQLFPVFDFAAAVDAISEVETRLHAIWQETQSETQTQNHSGDQPETKTVLVIAGLDTLTEAVIRSSNAVRGTAVLTSLLRTITQMSRMHRGYLSVLLVNTAGVGPSPSLYQAQGRNQRENDTHSGNGGGSDIQSMFYSDGPLFPSLLMKTLDQGIDTHLLVSTTASMTPQQRRNIATVVEVVKDRVGCGLGRWYVWDEEAC